MQRKAEKGRQIEAHSRKRRDQDTLCHTKMYRKMGGCCFCCCCCYRELWIPCIGILSSPDWSSYSYTHNLSCIQPFNLRRIRTMFLCKIDICSTYTYGSRQVRSYVAANICSYLRRFPQNDFVHTSLYAYVHSYKHHLVSYDSTENLRHLSGKVAIYINWSGLIFEDHLSDQWAFCMVKRLVNDQQ